MGQGKTSDQGEVTKGNSGLSIYRKLNNGRKKVQGLYRNYNLFNIYFPEGGQDFLNNGL